MVIVALIAGVVLIDSFDLMSGDTRANEDSSVKLVTVQGEGTVKVKPDVAYINVGVESSDVDAQVAQEENKEKWMLF